MRYKTRLLWEEDVSSVHTFEIHDDFATDELAAEVAHMICMYEEANKVDYVRRDVASGSVYPISGALRVTYNGSILGEL
jgi:hypothetical protein